MKLMLTSDGISNPSLRKALKGLVKGKIKIAFIPTAANVEWGDKDWLIKNFIDCQKIGEVDIVDIAALDKKDWLPRLKEANVIFVGGGNDIYLMDHIKKSGLANELPKLLETRVYVGISAGSAILSKIFSFRGESYYEEQDGKEHKGLGYVDFRVFPHLNSPYFPKIREELFNGLPQKLDLDIYAIDDRSAVIVDEGKVSVVSEGKWKYYPK